MLIVIVISISQITLGGDRSQVLMINMKKEELLIWKVCLKNSWHIMLALKKIKMQ